VNPNLWAFAASLIFGFVVFPWTATLKRLGSAEFFMITGIAYFVAGAAQYAMVNEHNRLTAPSIGLAILTAGMYVGALLCVNFAFTHPRVSLPIAAAITAAYPAWTALAAVIFLGQRFTIQEAAFLLMVIGGVVGLGLFSKPVSQ